MAGAGRGNGRWGTEWKEQVVGFFGKRSCRLLFCITDDLAAE